MDTLTRLMEISSRLDHLENIAEWISRETVNADGGLSQSGTLICVLADEVREAIYEMAKSFEEHQEDIEPILDIDEETIH
ncbi:MAG: hypothetical protein KDD70_18870 [Bdellovibrionales bacterium]|nr:hypothetical protein [Bdellovibrionales bacterium]